MSDYPGQVFLNFHGLYTVIGPDGLPITDEAPSREAARAILAEAKQ